MQTTVRSHFSTIKTEGAILPADLLQRVSALALDGMRPQDYHLAPNERLLDAISRSWNRLRGVWAGFEEARAALPASDRGTSLTRERWLLILFEELGYGRLPFRGSLPVDSATDRAAEDVGAGFKPAPTYPISHEYEAVPIHLVSFRQSLERTDEERAERYRRSPHSLLQEFLNRSQHRLWGFVSNGLQLRVLRDNASLTRAAFLEFDLEGMMNGEQFADFQVLWLVCHVSRVAGGRWQVAGEEESTHHSRSTLRPLATNHLERWSQEAAEQGTRALDSLREGVQEAIEALGRGFLAHPANDALRDRLRVGTLSGQVYYRQLLRLVYRLVFLFVAEERDLLLLPVERAGAAARQRYNDYYSLGRLRPLAVNRKGGDHPDLYRGLRRVMACLRDGYAPLALPALGGFLFSERAAPELDAADLRNEDLLNAIRALAYTVEGRVLRQVDYRNLGAEELGSVYESLLELHPQLNVAAASFSLSAVAGSERKTTGSYYTPSSLINSLLDSALEPVVEERLRGKRGAEAEEALLALKVVDPAAGSGHFLLAAANRLAVHLARLRTGDAEPSPADRRDALRDVVGRCIYGVDLNEMAVELCKVGLWLETLDPGRPLSFLDHHIRHGNSLIGATPALLARGIPDEVFTPITGDNKEYVREWKKRNKQEREGQGTLRLDAPWERLGDLAAAMARLEDEPDDTAEGVRAKEAAYARLVESSEYLNNQLLADTWCAAFVFPKHYGIDFPISENDFRDIERNPHSVARWMKAEIERLREQHHFFHWHLAFPEVFRPIDSQTSEVLKTSEVSDSDDPTGWEGGFDVVLGNPPWERIKLQEKEWFARRDPEIANAPNAAARGRLINALQQENPALYAAFLDDRRAAEGESHIARNSGRYPLCGRGDVNTYALFAELARHLTGERGRAGIIIQSDIATGDTNKLFFADLVEQRKLVSFYDFVNTEGLFPDIHRTHPHFCLITMSGESRNVPIDFAFWNTNTGHLADEERHFTLTAEEIALLNPNTRTCPIFRSKRDAELTKAIYRRVPVLIQEADPVNGRVEANPWGISFLRMFDMSNDSGLFRTREELEGAGWRLVGNRFVGEEGSRGAEEQRSKEEQSPTPYLPLYEAKMLHHFDHRWATYEGGDTRDVTAVERNDPAFVVRPRYWVDAQEVADKLEDDQIWLLAFRDITNTTNERTAIFSPIPLAAVGNNAPLLLAAGESHPELLLLAASLSTYAFDFIARLSVGGTHMNFFIVKQLAVLPPETYQQPCSWAAQGTLHDWLLPRVLELTYTAYDLRPFALDCGYHGPPFRWDEERRFWLRCELDAAYFHLYGIDREDVDYIMDTFPIVRRKDEAAYGEYRTKQVILDIYDEMAAATASGQPYQTHLDPPPADPAAAHPWDTAYLGAELPREKWWQVERGSRGAEEQGSEGVRPVYQTSQTSEVLKTSEVSATTASGGGRPLELKRPVVEKKQGGGVSRRVLRYNAGAGEQRSRGQSALPLVAPPPEGPRAVRLRRAMALGKEEGAAATAELVAFLADEDSNIRWLAGSSLAQRGDAAGVVAAIAAFVNGAGAERVTAAREELRRVLSMVAETAEEEEVRERAREILKDEG